MIADGDSVARNAFRVALLTAAPDETPLPVNTTQELDPSDILEVRDMAEAIARAERIVAAPRSSRPSSRRNGGDIFESLGHRPTDDTAGPATPAPVAIAAIVTAAQLLRPESITRPISPISAMVLSLPVAAPVTEDDAYFHPAGRIRSLADVTLDGYRPEPTLLLRARGRRKSISWILGAALLPLVALAAIALLGRQETAPADTATSTTTIATATIVATAARPSPPALKATAAATAAPIPVSAVSAVSTVSAQARGPIVIAAKPAVESQGSVPVFDVNSLPTARSGDKSRSGR